MHVTLYRLRDLGRRRKWRDIDNGPKLVGRLNLSRTLYKKGTVAVEMLTLLSTTVSNQSGRLDVLYEPVVTGLGNDVITFLGFEKIETADGVASYAQEWRCEITPAGKCTNAGQS